MVVSKDPHLNIVVLAHQEELLNQFELSLWTFLPKYVQTHVMTSDHQRPYLLVEYYYLLWCFESGITPWRSTLIYV